MNEEEISSRIGTLMLLAWPLLSVMIFSRFRTDVAIPAVLLAGYLLLPPKLGIDLPIVPVLDKSSGAALGALLVALYALYRASTGQRGTSAGGENGHSVHVLPGWIPRDVMALVFISFLIVGPVITALTNSDPILKGDGLLPGLRLYDAGGAILSNLVMLIPLVLGRKFLFSAEHHRSVLVVFALGIAAYAVLALYEVRMSPQLNRIVYGYFPHDWIQHLRQDGFRPLVFLTHGLILGVLLCLGTLAAVGAARLTTGRTRLIFGAIALYTFVTLVLAKSLGALMIVTVLLPVALIAGRRLQLLAAASIAVMVIGYPYLRTVSLAPTGPVIALAERIDAQRADSFAFRIENEERLLEKARERPLAGWGSWGRNRVFDDRGRDISVTDGYWIGTFGATGVLGYFGQFGLLTIPLIALAIRTRRHGVTLATSALALLMAANLIDLIPNASIGPFTWLIAGAMLGRLEAARTVDEDQPDPVVAAPDPDPIAPAPQPVSRYARTHAPAAPQPASALANDAPLQSSRHTRFARRHVRPRP